MGYMEYNATDYIVGWSMAKNEYILTIFGDNDVKIVSHF